MQQEIEIDFLYIYAMNQEKRFVFNNLIIGTLF